MNITASRKEKWEQVICLHDVCTLLCPQ